MAATDGRALADLGAREPGEIRRWLRENQPDRDSERAFWWESLATRALHGVYQATGDDSRLRYARVVKAATEEAVDLAVLSEVDGAIRVAYLTARLGELGAGLFDVDEVVARCLALIELPPDEAADRAADWRSLPHAGILALRRAKNLVSASVPLADRVTDAALRAELTRWGALRDRLP
jgi:hypothetical protein